MSKYQPFTNTSAPIVSFIIVSTLMLASVIAQAKEEVPKWYTIGGLAVYSEDFGETLEEGLGVRVGVGVQLNETFGAELVRDFIPDLGSVVSSVFLNVIGAENEVKSSGYVYSSLFGSLRIPTGEDVWLVAKVGIGHYYYEAEFKYQNNSVVEQISREGSTPVAAFGIQFPFGEKENLLIEISATHYFEEEVKTTGYGLSAKYSF